MLKKLVHEYQNTVTNGPGSRYSFRRGSVTSPAAKIRRESISRTELTATTMKGDSAKLATRWIAKFRGHSRPCSGNRLATAKTSGLTATHHNHTGSSKANRMYHGTYAAAILTFDAWIAENRTAPPTARAYAFRRPYVNSCGRIVGDSNEGH